MKKKRKTFRNFIKDIVFNDPRADRQSGSWDGEDDDWVDRHMLYDKKEKREFNAPFFNTHTQIHGT